MRNFMFDFQVSQNNTLALIISLLFAFHLCSSFMSLFETRLSEVQEGGLSTHSVPLFQVIRNDRNTHIHVHVYAHKHVHTYIYTYMYSETRVGIFPWTINCEESWQGKTDRIRLKKKLQSEMLREGTVCWRWRWRTLEAGEIWRQLTYHMLIWC